MKIKGILLTVASAMLFGITPILTKMTYGMGCTPATVTFYRNLMILPVLLAIMWWKKVDLSIDRKTFGQIFVIGGIGGGVTTMLLYSSYHYISVGTATTLHFLYPVFVALICSLFYGEKLGKVKAFALAAATGGIALFFDGGGSSMVGIAIALLSGLTYGYYMVAVEKKGLSDMNCWKLTFYQGFSITLGLLVYQLFAGDIIFIQTPKVYGLLFVIAMGTSLLGVLLLQLGIRYVGATTAAIFCMFEPITSVLAGALLLHEGLPLLKGIGCAVILGAAFLVVVSGKEEPEEAQLQQARGEVRIGD